MSLVDKSPKARQWLNWVHVQVKQGGYDLNRVLSDNGGEVPTPNQWSSVISFICAYEKKAGRETMMKTVLAHPDFPKNTFECDNGNCMADAVRRRALECIPLLHQAGFTLKAHELSKGDRDHLIVDKMSNEIANGRWPHVELIYPNLLDDASSHRNIVEGLFNETSRQGYNVAKKLVKLAPNEGLTRMISKRLGRFGRELKGRDEEGVEKALAPMRTLLAAGWLNLDLAKKEATEDDMGHVVAPLITLLERETLALATASTTAKKNRVRL